MSEMKSRTTAYELPDKLEPSETAILVVDMQNMECSTECRGGEWTVDHIAFVDYLKEIIIPKQQEILARARSASSEIIFTTIESLTLDGRDRSLDYKRSNLHAPKGSYEAKVIEELNFTENDIHIPKTSSSVFCSTNINYVLRNLGISNLAVMGIVTEQCVEGAIRDGADFGYRMILLEDCCASYCEARQKECVKRLHGHFCSAVSGDAFIKALE